MEGEKKPAEWQWSFGWEENSGLVCLYRAPWNIHLLVQRGDWLWGREKDWYDGELKYWGFGPLFLVAWAEI